MDESVQVDGGSVRVDHLGMAHAGHTTVVFLHAGVADRRMWSEQLTALADHYEVLAYDRRGFGDTSSEDVPFSQVGDLLAVLDHYQVGSACLVGCSQGGRVALDFALAHSRRVNSLVLLAPAVSGDEVEFEHSTAILQLAARIDAAEEAGDLERLNALEAHAWLDGPASAVGRVGGTARELFLAMNDVALRAAELAGEQEPPPAFPQLAGLLLPVLLVWGELDFPYVIDRCHRIAAALPNAREVMIPGVAHLPNLERAEEINSLLDQFLSEAFGQHS